MSLHVKHLNHFVFVIPTVKVAHSVCFNHFFPSYKGGSVQGPPAASTLVVKEEDLPSSAFPRAAFTLLSATFRINSKSITETRSTGGS